MSSPAQSQVTIRHSRPGDSAGIRRLAALDSAPVPGGPLLLALLDGRLLAAVSLGDGRAIADPFAHTLALVELLRARARPSVPPPGRAGRRRLRAGERAPVAHR